MKTPNILFISHDASMYGASKSLYNIITYFHNNHLADCTVLCRNDGPFVEKLRTTGITVYVMPFELWIEFRAYKSIFKLFALNPKYFIKKYYRLLFSNIKLIKNIYPILKEKQIDVVYSNTIVMNFGWRLSKKLKAKHIWHIRETMHYCDGIKPVVPIFWHTIYKSHKIFLVSTYQKKILCLNNAIVIPNPVEKIDKINELSRKASKKQLFKSEHHTFCIIGNITPNKGQEDAIYALALVIKVHPQTRLKIIGGGHITEIQRLQQIASELNISDAINFTGYIENTYSELLNCDASLMCSKQESFGRVTIESIICKRPVIGFNGSATPELLGTDGTIGMLYNTPEELARIMIRFIGYPELPQRIANNAFEALGRKYSTEASVEAIWNEIKDVLKTND